MMKIFISPLLCLALAATTATAGGPSDPVIEAPVVVEDTASSSSGVVVPLLLLAVVLIAASSSSGGAAAAPAPVSDARLKTDITRVGQTAHGLPLYQFRYIGGEQMFEGVMAQDVAQIMPEAVVPFAYGYNAVNYTKLGIEMRLID